MGKKYDDQYYNIVSPILNIDLVDQMRSIKHHNSNRLDHSLKVSYHSYKIAKCLKLNYREVARAGLLHDFYLDRTKDYKKVKDKVLLYTTRHPQNAVENAKSLFDLSDREEDIIASHMFPIDIKVPKYAESWIVSLVDKGISTAEFVDKFRVQLTYIMNVYLLFVLNIIKV